MGSTGGYVGFTGADGGAKSTQAVSGFTYIPYINLSFQPSGTATVISWPTGVGGYVLQQSASLAPANWMTLTNAASVVNEENQVVLPAIGRAEFYKPALPVPPL